MYRLNAEGFSLELTPRVLQEKFPYPEANSLRVQVSSRGFSADSFMDVDDLHFAAFAVQLNELYETLKGSVRLEEPYSMHCFLEFIAAAGGHIHVKGNLHNKMGIGHAHELTFENEFDQTYLRTFAKALFADYGRYAEEIPNLLKG